MADKAGTSTKKIEKRLTRLEESLEQAEEKRRKLKKRVKDLQRNLAEVESDLAEALEDLEEEEDDEESEASVAPGARHLSEPDTSWTVTRLREAATSRGLTGVSRMSKAKLLAALSSS